MLKKRDLTVVIITFIMTSTANAQINEAELYKVDSLISIWNIPDDPGGVIGIRVSYDRVKNLWLEKEK